ncbi:hypothetical protein C1H46_015653 [Malus baccata]|uniref:PGG domain-containing protein n=1 Tax=Malus baccata TaxID=106549 RepID=A0A540MJ14_MALBA|nr:hypothetical protein C1H46_015653 [Malus baccata]
MPQPDQKEREDSLRQMEELKRPYEYAMNEEWKDVKEYFENNPEKLLYKMTVEGDTVFHLAGSLSSKSQGTEVLEMLINKISTSQDKKRALRVPNNYGDNTLHEVSLSGNEEAAKYLVSNFNEPVQEEVIISTSTTDKQAYKQKRDSENGGLQLLETRNYLGETPLFRAAALGHTDLINSFCTFVFHNAETALWLLEKYRYLAHLREDNGLTSLQLLAQMPTAFDPNFKESKWKMLIYHCLPDGGDVVTPNQKDDVESSMDSNHPCQSIFRNKLAGTGGPLGKIINMIWNDKKNKKSLKKLIRLLIELDACSWLITNKQPNIRTISLGSREPNKEKEATKSDTKNGDDGGKKGKAAADEHLSGVRENTESYTTNGDCGCKKEKEETKSKKEARNEVYNSTPLLIATITGIVPIVQEILEQRPQAGELVNENERNILHLAIKNRKKEILDLIKSKPTLMSKLNKRIDHNGNTILHQAADRTYYSISLSQKLVGPAMQLQEELRWVERIKEMLPPRYIMHHNHNDQTAEELFNAGHDELLKSAQEWVKETAQSCSTVAVLVATVVFAAAYAIPGGFNDKSGRPVFQDNPLFLLFTCMDVVAIACSLSSVAFFLSVLSSPLEYPYFVKSIPHKVMIGFILLFFSMATTMLAFAATILLLIRVKKKWTMSILYPIAFFPVLLFGLLQFPMYQSFKGVSQKIDALLHVLGLRKKISIWGKSKAYRITL